MPKEEEDAPPPSRPKGKTFVQTMFTPVKKILGLFGFDTEKMDALCSAGSFIESVHPDVKKMTKVNYVLAAGAVVILVQITAFFYFLFTSYYTKMNTQYLALAESAGVCEPVTLSTTDTLHLDKNGHWDQSGSFSPQEALFTVQFSAYRADDASWLKDMDLLNAAIKTEMDLLRGMSDLPTKVLHLISWRQTINATKTGKFMVWFNADPTYIFDVPGAQLDAQMGAQADSCVENDAWSMKGGVLSLTFDEVWEYGKYSNDGDADLTRTTTGSPGWDCPNFDIMMNGYNVGYPTESFSLLVDLRAAATVAALNSKVVAEDQLLTIADKFYVFQSDDDTNDNGVLKMEVKYDPKYPDMTSVYKGDPYDETVVATKYQQRIGYSLWDVEFSGWHYKWAGGASDSWDTPTFTGPFNCPAKCDVSARYCNTPDFVFSFSMADSTTSPNQQFKINLYADELFTMNTDNFDPGHIGCKTTSKGGAGKLGNMDPVSDADFATNLDAQPFKLTEDYFACTPEAITAFFDAMGIAQGNAGLFVAVTVAFIMFFAGKVPGLVETGVSDDEINNNSKAMAEALKFVTLGEDLKGKHKDLQGALKKFLAADISTGEGSKEAKFESSETARTKKGGPKKKTEQI